MPYLRNNALHWREQAVETRRLVYMADPSERERMLGFARMYDRLAEMAERPEDRDGKSD